MGNINSSSIAAVSINFASPFGDSMCKTASQHQYWYRHDALSPRYMTPSLSKPLSDSKLCLDNRNINAF